MRTRNALERLVAVAPAVELPVDAGEEDRILARILASPRAPARRRRPLTLALAGVAVLAAAGIVGALELGSAKPPAPVGSGHRHVALTGVTFKIAGYHFRTPAGYKRSTAACLSAPVPGQPRPAIDGFAAAASADGGCLEAAYLIADQPLQGSPDAQPVEVGQYQGYYVAQTQGAGGKSSLLVDLPKAGGDQYTVSLELLSSGLTEDQLIAVAESGLPTLPPAGPTETTGTETSG